MDPFYSKKANDFIGTIYAVLNQIMKLTSMPLESRPREKALKYGLSKLDNTDLLAIFLGSGSKDENALDLARKILEFYQLSLRTLGDATFDELIKIKGIGRCKAILIEALGEWARRYSSMPISLNAKIETSYDIYQYMHAKLAGEYQEILLALMLDSKKRLIGESLISKGGINKITVEAREIFKPAIKRGAKAIILIHNHPSGDPEPSNNDFKMTLHIRKCGEILGITLLDHLIIGDGNYYSLFDKKLYFDNSLQEYDRK